MCEFIFILVGEAFVVYSLLFPTRTSELVEHVDNMYSKDTC